MKMLVPLVLAVGMTACATSAARPPVSTPRPAPGTVSVTLEEFYVLCFIETLAKARHGYYILDACF